MKKPYPFICFVFILWVSGLLQANPCPWQSLSLPKQADTLKSIILKLDAQNLDSVLKLSKRLQYIARELEDDQQLAFSIRQIAWAYKRKNDLGQSIQHYFELERLYGYLQDISGLGTTYLNIGQIFANAYDYDRALQYLKLAKDHYLAIRHDYRVSGAMYEMAKRHIEKKDPETAIELLFEALKVCPDRQVPLISMIYNRLGWATKDLGDYNRARAYYQKSILGLEDLPNWDKKKAIAYNNIGESYLLEGQFDSADWYLRKALVMKEQFMDRESVMETMNQLANLAYQLGNINKALQWLDKGISNMDPNQLSEKLGDALSLFKLIAADPLGENLVPHETMKRYFNIQQQQLMALQHVQKELGKSALKYNIQIGENQYAHEQEARTLKASLTDSEYKVTRQERKLTGILAFVLAVMVLGYIWSRKLVRRDRKLVKDKNAFVKDLIKKYDYDLLQLTIIKAEYEEIIEKLKSNPGSNGH